MILSACALVSDKTETERLDPDNDGVDWPNDCDDNDPNVKEAETLYLDEDGDGFGDLSKEEKTCTPTQQHVKDKTDCNDDDPDIHPGAVELCDDADNNCNGLSGNDDLSNIDPSQQNLYYADDDGDSFGDPDNSVFACTTPYGHVEDSTDCDDSEAAVNPGMDELCSTIDVDDNCDGEVD